MSKYSELILKGNEEYNSGNYETALNLYNAAAEIEPENPEAWIDMGNTEQWTQKFNRDTSAAIERSYKDYEKAVSVAVESELLTVNKEIFSGLMKQANVLAGSILKCQNSDDSFYQIEEMVNANRIMLTWLTNFFFSPKFDFRSLEEEQFDFILSITDLINLNIQEYYHRIPNGNPTKDLKEVKLIFTYELLTFLKTLSCYKAKKQAIVNQIREQIDCLREGVSKLYNERHMLEDEKSKCNLTEELDYLKNAKKQLKFGKDVKVRIDLKRKIEKIQDEVKQSEKKYDVEISRLDVKIQYLIKEIEFLQGNINERMSLFM